MPHKLLGWLLLALLLSGCSKVKENLKPVPLEPIETSEKVKAVWSRQAGAGQDARYQRLQPLVRGDTIYVVDVNGELTALDVTKGKTLWRQQLDTTIGGGVGAAADTLLVGTLKGEIIALNQSDGSEKWRADLSSEIVSTPSGDDSVVVAQTIDGRVFAMKLTDGSILWTYDHPVPILTLRAQGGPLVLDQTVYMPFDNGQILAFNTVTGQLKWSTRVGQPKGKTEIERLVDVDTTPLLRGPFLYAGGYQSRIVAINRGTGRINWAQDNSTDLALAEADGKLITVDQDSHVKAFDATTGTLLWENAKLHRRELSPPGILDNRVLVSDYKGYVHVLDLETGDFVGRHSTQLDLIYAAPITIDDTILLLDKSGKLVLYRLHDKDAKDSSDSGTRRARGPFKK